MNSGHFKDRSEYKTARHGFHSFSSENSSDHDKYLTCSVKWLGCLLIHQGFVNNCYIINGGLTDIRQLFITRKCI